MEKLQAKHILLIKILLDFTMFILYIILTFRLDTGLLFHEVAGLGIALLFGVHIQLNHMQMKGLLKGKAKKKKQLYNIVTDIALLWGMTIVIITGILISKYLFVIDLSEQQKMICSVHKITSYVCLGILGMHLLLHARYLMGALKSIYTNKRAIYVRRILAGFMCICIFSAFVYTQIKLVVDKKTIESEQHSEQQKGDKNTGDSLEGTENPPESLEDYLGGLTCRGCAKHCSLLALKCHSGEREVETFTQKYYELYETK